MELNGQLVGVIAVVAGALAIFLVLAFVASRIRRVPPNEALIVVGRGAGKSEAQTASQRVVVGGRAFVWPVLQQGQSEPSGWQRGLAHLPILRRKPRSKRRRWLRTTWSGSSESPSVPTYFPRVKCRPTSRARSETCRAPCSRRPTR